MRLQLQGLCRRAVRQEGRAAEPVRAGRQGNRPHAQDALCGARRGAGLAAAAARRAPRTRCRRRRPAARATIRSTPPFCRARRLNKQGSEKETWHIEFDLADCGLDYAVGDSFGIFPAQRPGAGRRDHRGARRAGGFPDRRAHAARGADRRRVAVARARHAVPAVLLHHRRRAPEEGQGAGRRAKTPTATPRRSTCWRRSRNSPACGPIPKPSSRRSIRCSRGSIRSRRRPRCDRGRVALTVDAVRYEIGKRTRLGVASTFLAGRIEPGDKLRVYVQKAQHFGLPADPAVPIIMIGPGTGVAPFRAFLHERMATKAPGRNWLFFGHQHRDYDFFYEDELAGMKAAGVLTRLYARLVARRRREILCAGPHAPGRPRAVGVDRRRRAHLCLRRCPAHGQGRRARADRHRRRARRAHDQRGGRLRRPSSRRPGRYQADVY